MRREIVRLVTTIVLGGAAGAWPAPAAATLPAGTERVPREAILDAVRAEQGYERRATANQSRLQSRVLLRLAESGGLLFIDHDDWFQAYVQALDLRPEDAPLSVRLSHAHQYDIVVDARPGVVVERVRAGPRPSRALNVRWRSRRGTPRYSYRDERATPVLEMSFERTVSYRLLELDGMVVLEQIQGISGRPTTGPLSLLFRLFGNARAVWSRSIVASDGWQVVVGRGRKGPFARSATVTIRPDGRIDPDLPAGRADLASLERRLRAPLEIVYRPWDRD
jgi:hypothetical protein